MLEWTHDPDRVAELERARVRLRELLLSLAATALPGAEAEVRSDTGPTPVDLRHRPGVAKCLVDVVTRGEGTYDRSEVVLRARSALIAAGWEADQPGPLGWRLGFKARRADGHSVKFYVDDDGVETSGCTPEVKTAEVRHVQPEPVRTAETVQPGELLCYECRGLGWCVVCEGDGWLEDGEWCPLCSGKKVCPICRGRGVLAIGSLSPLQRSYYPELRSE